MPVLHAHRGPADARALCSSSLRGDRADRGSFFFYWYGDHRDLHSFPTRRSSDLLPPLPHEAADRAVTAGPWFALDPGGLQVVGDLVGEDVAVQLGENRAQCCLAVGRVGVDGHGHGSLPWTRDGRCAWRTGAPPRGVSWYARVDGLPASRWFAVAHQRDVLRGAAVAWLSGAGWRRDLGQGQQIPGAHLALDARRTAHSPVVPERRHPVGADDAGARAGWGPV